MRSTQVRYLFVEGLSGLIRRRLSGSVAIMIMGAALAHNFALAATPTAVSPAGKTAVVLGLVVCLVVGWSTQEK